MITISLGRQKGADAFHASKAMVHAVELCGGGEKPEPF
jgi:hypothetical protein